MIKADFLGNGSDARPFTLRGETKRRSDMANQNEHRGGSGNFAEDRERAREAGRKGGEHSHQPQHSQSGGDNRQQGGSERGGSGNFKNDPDRAREAGRKGGQH